MAATEAPRVAIGDVARLNSSGFVSRHVDLVTVGSPADISIDIRLAFTGTLEGDFVDLVSGFFSCAQRDILFLVDRSGSMSAAYGATTRMEAAKQAMLDALVAIAATNTETRAGLLWFSAYWNDGFGLEGSVGQFENPPGLTSDWTALGAKISSLGPGGYGTPTGDALAYARTVMEAGATAPHPVIVLVSDGEWNLGSDPIPIASDMVLDHPDWEFYVVDVSSSTPNPTNVVLGGIGNGYFLATDPAALAAAIAQASDPCFYPLPLTFEIDVSFDATMEAYGTPTSTRRRGIYYITWQ